MARLVSHRVPEVDDDFRTPVRTDRLRLPEGSRILDPPQPLDQAAQTR
jgi:hypothetical protein